MPNFAYNSAGHIVLQNDLTVDHQYNHNREVVHSVSGVEHTQLDFAKATQEYQSANHPQTVPGT